MITNRERENETLSFTTPADRGAVEETFYPWNLTIDAFLAQGLPEKVGDLFSSKPGPAVNKSSHPDSDPELERFFPRAFGDSSMRFESYLGFDAVRRISFTLPFRSLDERLIEENEQHVIRQNSHGQTVQISKASGTARKLKEAVTDWFDWERIKEQAKVIIDRAYTDEQIKKAYLPFKAAHDRGDYSLRLNLEGFFWTPRELMGIEEHLYAFYDLPELMHDINETILDIYTKKLTTLLKLLPADVVYIMEDLSGKNGPMLSPELFDEFVGSYYQRLVPVLKQYGVKHVFVDTDGDFMSLIPHFIKSGIEGFLPLDVNAGMDIVEVRRQYPELKLIGGYNKLSIAEGKIAIDKEFERILPVIRQGGYIPGCDHQVAPSTSYENYQYYITRLKEMMKQSGVDS